MAEIPVWQEIWEDQLLEASVSRCLRALIRGTTGFPSLSISYRPSASDFKGRLYAHPFGAQRLPRDFVSSSLAGTAMKLIL